VILPPLLVDGPSPEVLPAFLLPGRERSLRPLAVLEQEIRMRTRFGWIRIPRGYVTDFASIPVWATVVTGFRLQPLGRWAWAALAHDMGYAVGQPGYRAMFDEILRERMAIDQVSPAARAIISRAVRLGGQGGYDAAPGWWNTENFADPDGGAYPVRPPFAREAAFVGREWGMRQRPDWPELAAAA
jgi:hypothetical protein